MNRFSPFLLRSIRTLKFRLALAVAALFGTAVAGFTLFQLAETRESMASILSEQQNTLIQRVAEEIDDKFRDRRAALLEVSEVMSPHLEGDLGKAGHVLSEQRALLTMFSDVLMFTPDGTRLASEPRKEALRNLNIGERGYFIRTVHERRPLISRPYKGTVSGAPYVMMTQPVLDSNGNLIAVLAGVINLAQYNFLGEIGATRIGREGYFFIFTRDEHPIVVSHPNPERLLKPPLSMRNNSPAQMALKGYEGTSEGVNGRGVQSLMSYKRLKEADWVLAATLPSNEAFAPIAQSQRRTAVAGGVLALIVALAMWLLVWRALRPLAALRDNVRQRIDDPRGTLALHVTKQDEIGELTRDFNRLMDAQRRAVEDLATGEERLRTITDNLPALIAYVDRDLRYRFNNKVYSEWFGLPMDKIVGHTIAQVQGRAEYESSREALEQALSGYPVTLERESIIAGRRRYIQATYLPRYDAQHQVAGLYILKTDLTERRIAEEKLAYVAGHDALTGLTNRGAFLDLLEHALRRAHRARLPCALMYLDIDRFKSINDTYGHGIGDCLLRDFAGRLQGVLRGSDVAGRLGGDEFVVLIEQLGAAEDASLVAEKIVAAMRAPFVYNGLGVAATTSIGITVYHPTREELTATKLLERADKALYEAKAAGRNTFRLLQAA